MNLYTEVHRCETPEGPRYGLWSNGMDVYMGKDLTRVELLGLALVLHTRQDLNHSLDHFNESWFNECLRTINEWRKERDWSAHPDITKGSPLDPDVIQGVGKNALVTSEVLEDGTIIITARIKPAIAI